MTSGSRSHARFLLILLSCCTLSPLQVNAGSAAGKAAERAGPDASRRHRLLPALSTTKLYRRYLRSRRLIGGAGTVLGPGGGTRPQGFQASAVPGTGEVAPSSDAEAFSATNIQVSGVDEGDTVKSDSAYLYAIHGSTVCLIRTPPDGSLQLVSSIEFESDFFPSELHLDGDSLAVIGSLWPWQDWPLDDPAALIAEDTVPGDSGLARQAASGASQAILLPFQEPKLAVKVFDLSNKAAPRLVRDFSLSGYLLGTRRIGRHLYLVGQYAPWFDDLSALQAMNGEPGSRVRGARRPSRKEIVRRLLPRLRDQAADDPQDEPEEPLPLDDIGCFDDTYEFSYLNIVGIDLADHAADAQVKAFVGSGEVLYVSQQHLYVARQHWDWRGGAEETDTDIRKFSLREGAAEFVSGGTIPGTLLNQFSMDEAEGNLRVAVTSWSWGGENPQEAVTNSIFVLGTGLERLGSLEGLARGETIVAARFIKERCYLVTFRQVDPFFVIDLANPAAPAVLGELKLPGFSTYLHPYDDQHILGFGVDTDAEIPGLPKGLKIGLFDVTDPARPIQSHQLLLGEGSFSPFLYDYKSLLFSKEKNLLAFPVDRFTLSGDQKWTEVNWENEVQVYTLTLAQGFSLRGRFTHNTEANATWLSYRLLYNGSYLYSVSNARVMTHDLETVQERAALVLP